MVCLAWFDSTIQPESEKGENARKLGIAPGSAGPKPNALPTKAPLPACHLVEMNAFNYHCSHL